MRTFTTAFALFPATTTVYSAQIDMVVNDVTQLDQDMQTLTTDVRFYSECLLAQGPLLVDLGQVHVATRKGHYDSTSLPRPLSETDASRLIDHVNKTPAIDSPIEVQVLKSKKPLFDAFGTSSFIKGGLQILLDDHLDFRNEVLERTPRDLLQQANQVVDNISNALQSGIAWFS